MRLLNAKKKFRIGTLIVAGLLLSIAAHPALAASADLSAERAVLASLERVKATYEQGLSRYALRHSIRPALVEAQTQLSLLQRRDGGDELLASDMRLSLSSFRYAATNYDIYLGDEDFKARYGYPMVGSSDGYDYEKSIERGVNTLDRAWERYQMVVRGER